jgi:hypothetical protein
MRRRLGGLLAVLALAGGIAAQERPAPPLEIRSVALESSADLRRQFSQPAAEYRTTPFFVWNGDVSEAEIDRFLEDYRALGIGGFIVHPRFGLVTPYLSERWFALYRHTVERAKQMGMEVWIYDENPYPSGYAGGHVLAQMPEALSQGQGLTLRKLASLPADGGKGCRVLLRRSAFTFSDITGAGTPDAAGEHYCFETVQYPRDYYDRAAAYVDLLLPGVTEKFLEVTLPGYERAIGAELGKTVPGLFSDEPIIAPPTETGSIRWTPDFFEQFASRRGYDARPLLPAMFEEIGDWRRLRHDYYKTLLELFVERWSRPYHAYAEKVGLKWTGHYMEHEWPGTYWVPDNMAMYAWHHVPGIDALFNQFDEERGEQFGNVRMVKELASVANQMGQRRRLSETYGGAGWDFPFESLKRFGDWEYVLGVNLMNQHLSYLTLLGARKYDWPGSFSYHSAWWKHYRVLVDYFGRLSLALSMGEQRNPVLVLEPTSTAWMYQPPGESNDRLARLGQGFRALVNRLEAWQAEYDLGCESIIKDQGRIDGRRFVVGRRAYDVVVIPPGTENLDGPTVSLLETYLDAGGIVISFVDGPHRVDGAESGRVGEMALTHASRWLRPASLEDPLARDSLAAKDLTVLSGKLYHQRRQLADGEMLFFVNSSADVPARLEARLDGRSVNRYDALDGTIGPYPARLEDGRLVVSVEVPPVGSLLLTTSRAGEPAPPAPAPGPERRIAAAGPTSVRRVAQNVLRLDYCDLELNGAVLEDLWFHQAAQRVYRHHGFGDNPWRGMQYESETLDRDRFPSDSGFEATFHFEIAGGVPGRDLRAVVERPRLWRVRVNGVPVDARPDAWWLDRSFGVYDIGAQVRPGANTIALTVRPMSVHAEIQPVYVLGDFGLSAEPRGFRIVPPVRLGMGAWQAQGLPFYSDAVSYRQAFDLDGRVGGCKVRLGKWRGMVAEVIVNGQAAGIIGWVPYELDVSRLVRAGLNEIEVVVYGSLRNLLGPHLMRPGPAGAIGRWLWDYAPEHTPAGSQYDVVGYGLLEEFQLLEMERQRDQ